MSPGNASKCQLMVFWIGAAAIASLFALGAYASWPTNVLSGGTADTIKRAFGETFPQGWAFFTKSPEGPQAGAYVAKTRESLLVTPQSRASNLFGLSRNQRAQGPEIAVLNADHALIWVDCTGQASTCLSKSAESTPTHLTNSEFTRTICGDVVLTYETITPWLYRGFESVGDTRIVRTAHAIVDCSGKVDLR
ncbi:hypothetical protein RS86_01094 [Microbacterium azadirachtae]|uniref:Antimicrobial peptide system protein, SdpA family n=2 Tax=Microbacterium azadirachtae TaxID=582680 RepID=A0A0F0LM63_9MICO|nr:hypothetical protein RS86_01094 [Microbacterium azadirachtae]